MNQNTNSIPRVEIESELCKGCDFCVTSCPEECLFMSELINARGYRFAGYTGRDCTGCGICFYNCPEPGAITVYKKHASAAAS
ncbi:MAG TPA: 4Fe-4S dicluster domain-containing protein [candidate division Zixibacteria bacterium]